MSENKILIQDMFVNDIDSNSPDSLLIASDNHKTELYRLKKWGCRFTMNIWSFYCDDLSEKSFKKLFDWITEPYVKQMKIERTEMSELKKENKYLKEMLSKPTNNQIGE